MVIFYLEGIVHLILGNNTAHVIVTAQANQCALALRLNEEASYEGLNPIETEIRRRIYWLLFQADKSTACNRSRTINLRLDDAPGLCLPTEVDDEQITPDGIIPQPPGRTPTIAGFNIVTNLFRVLNDALVLQRRRAPPSVDGIIADLNTVARLSDEISDVTNNVASPLRIRYSSKHDSRATSPAHGWEEGMQARIRDFFAGVVAHESINSFRVMQVGQRASSRPRGVREASASGCQACRTHHARATACLDQLTPGQHPRHAPGRPPRAAADTHGAACPAWHAHECAPRSRTGAGGVP